MDLSQQELPLTAYFLRGGKDVRPCTYSYKGKKKKKDEEERPAEKFSTNLSTVQLPTPTTSSRKRKRTGHSEIQAKPQAVLTGTVEYDALSRNKEDLEFGTTPSKLPHRRDVIPHLETVPLATPATDRRRTVRVPGPQHIDREDTVIERFPLARSRRQLPSASTPMSSGLPDSTGSSASHLPVALNYSDPFCERKVDNPVQRDSALTKQCFNQPIAPDGQLPVVPVIPVSSSQSQYLLHIDATPKRRRVSRRIEAAASSPTQEERELTLLTSHRPALAHLLVGASPGKHMHGNAPTGLSYNKQKGQLQLGSTHVGSSPSRCESASYHSPSRKVKTPRRPTRQGSIENTPPTRADDSLTESESESDILRMKMKCKVSTLASPSRRKNQTSGYLPSTRDACPPPAGDNLAGPEDDSVTEAESDTEILRCAAEIGRKRLYNYPPQVAREASRPPPVISPLVSPARPRTAARPLIPGPTRFCTQEEVGSSSPELCAPSPSARGRPQIPSGTLPSVVQDFICMFSGDESYPVDFPESLRI